jgi:hypothetical protein
MVLTARFWFGNVTPGVAWVNARLLDSTVVPKPLTVVCWTLFAERMGCEGQIGPDADTSPWQFEAATRVKTSALVKFA